MSTRVVCPECGDRLKLHKPAIDSTRVKCRNCGNKFYAGKAENWSEEYELAGGFHPLPNPVGMSTISPAVATADPIVESGAAISETKPAERKQRERIRTESGPSSKWAMPLGILAVIGIALAGIFLGQTPAVPESNHSPVKERKQVAKPANSQLISTKDNFRPPELIGIWHTSDVSGGLLDFAADGTVRIRGAFLDQNQLDFVSQWFTVRVHGEDYVLEIGPEPKLTSNHGMRLVRQADGTLLMTRYATAASLNLEVRRFKKAE